MHYGGELGDGLDEPLALPLADADLDPDCDWLALPLMLADALLDPDFDPEALPEDDGLSDPLGLIDGDPDGLRDADGLFEADSLAPKYP